MKIYENGEFRQMTEQEIQEIVNHIPEEDRENINDRLERLEQLFDTIVNNLKISK